MNSIYKILFISFAAGFLFLHGYSKGDPAKYIYTDSLDIYDTILIIIDSTEIKRRKLTDGKILYEKKCVRCHMLHEPVEYNVKQWKRNLKEMKEKAELKQNEFDLILGYLSENAKK